MYDRLSYLIFIYFHYIWSKVNKNEAENDLKMRPILFFKFTQLKNKVLGYSYNPIHNGIKQLYKNNSLNQFSLF